MLLSTGTSPGGGVAYGCGGPCFASEIVETNKRTYSIFKLSLFIKCKCISILLLTKF